MTELYNVLLVDDEKFIMEGLSALIDWSRLGCRIAGKAYNGRMGLQLATELKPDLIVTDIRMPFMDGLEMIREIKQALGDAVQFIVLSGYSDFDYARSAMKYGVQHYLLKPVEETMLESSLKELAAELAAARKQAASLKQAEAYRRMARDHLLKELLLDGEAIGELLPLFADLGEAPPAPPGRCCAVALAGREAWREADALALEAALNAVAPSLRPMLCRYSEELLAVIVQASDRLPDPPSLRAALGAAAAARGLRLGIGSEWSAAEGISQSFQEALYALSYAEFHDMPAAAADDWEDAADGAPVPQLSYQSLVNALELLSLPSALECLDRLFDDLRDCSREHPRLLQLGVLNIVATLLAPLTYDQTVELGKRIGTDRLFPRHIAQGQPEEIRPRLAAIVRGIVELKQRRQREGTGSIIEEVKLYMEQHYAEPLSLSQVSERFYINPHYLSQLFKKKADTTFLSCLTRIRIDKSKELLANTELKIYEIAGRVGYEDTKYFSRSFEKYTGRKPSDYRAAARGQV